MHRPSCGPSRVSYSSCTSTILWVIIVDHTHHLVVEFVALSRPIIDLGQPSWVLPNKVWVVVHVIITEFVQPGQVAHEFNINLLKINVIDSIVSDGSCTIIHVLLPLPNLTLPYPGYMHYRE
jgi:hypothetical protein